MNPKVGLTKHRKPVPIRDMIIVTPMKDAEYSPGGILLPQVDRKKPEILYGTVVAVGPGGYTDAGIQLPMPVKVGDLISYRGQHVWEMKLDGEIFHLVDMGTMLAKIEENPY